MKHNRVEDEIANIVSKAKDTYIYNGANFNLTDEQKATFKPYVVKTVEDVIMIMAYALKENNSDLLIEIHDRLMVSDLTLAYDILIVMLMLGDGNKMYGNFVPFTEKSQIDSKGIYRRCLGAIGFYAMGNAKGYHNPILGIEYVRDFGNGINGINITDETDLKENRRKDFNDCFIGQYRKHIAFKYADLIKKVLSV